MTSRVALLLLLLALPASAGQTCADKAIGAAEVGRSLALAGQRLAEMLRYRDVGLAAGGSR